MGMYNELLAITRDKTMPKHLKEHAEHLLNCYGAGHFNTEFDCECARVIHQSIVYRKDK